MSHICPKCTREWYSNVCNKGCDEDERELTCHACYTGPAPYSAAYKEFYLDGPSRPPKKIIDGEWS